MQITKMGDGPWADVSVEGTTVILTVGEQSRVYDCDELQQDAPVTFDLVMDANGHLTDGVDCGDTYVANLTLPEARYVTPPTPEGTADADMPEPQRVPLTAEDMEAVRLTLWTVTAVPSGDGMFGGMM